MQTVSFGSLSRPQVRQNTHAVPRFGDIPSTPPNSPQLAPEVEQLNPASPVDEYEKQATEEFEKALQDQQAQTRSFLKGVEQGLDVIHKNAEWRHQFSEAKAVQGEDKENIFDQLSSLYHLTVARFKEACPPKAKENKAEATADKAAPTGTQANKQARESAAPQPKPADATDQAAEPEEIELKPNPEAFKHYQKVLNRYPALALMDKEVIPFDMGRQAALSSKNPDKLMQFVQQKRNAFNKIQLKIRTEIENKQLKEDKAAEFQREQLRNSPALKTIRQELREQFKAGQ